MLGRLIAGVVVRPVTTTMVTIAVVLFGLVAALRLPVDLLPDLSYPSITVDTTYPDAAPSEVEELVTRPVEELVGGVPGVVSVESASREARSEVVLDFAWGTRIDQAMADVREKLDRVRLPTDAERPVVLRYDPAQEPILRLALIAPPLPDDAPEAARVRRFAEVRDQADRYVKRALEKLPGVAAVELHGGDEEEVVVELDPARLAALQVDASEVVAAIQADNVNRPGGAITDRDNRYQVRTVHEARSAADVGDIIVRSDASARLRVRDLARVRRRPVEREELSLVGDREAVELAVYREGDANTVAVATAVLEATPRLPLPEGYEMVTLANQARFIEAAVREVVVNTVLGGVLAVLVLLFFLRDLRATVVIAVAIPISLLATFIPLNVLGVSLNLMSLGGLALGVGMLVDNSIVVLESIARVREEEPEASARDTASRGTRDVASSVVASTLTTVAVFLPMAFVAGVAGQLVRDLAFAVSFSILSSMLVSLTLVPVLQSVGLGDDAAAPGAAPEQGPPRRAPLVAALVFLPALVWWPIRGLVWLLSWILGTLALPFTWAYDALERTYPTLLRGALRVRGLVLLGAVALCVLSLGAARRSGQTLLPQVDQGEFFVQIELPQGTSLDHTTRSVRALVAAIADDEDVELVFARVGSVTQGGSATGTQLGTHLAQVNVRLRPGLEDLAGAEGRLEAAMLRVAEPGAKLRLDHPALFSFAAPIELRIFGEEPARVAEHARRLLPELAAIEGLADVTPDDLAGRPEVRVDFDRERLGRLELDVDAAAAAVQRSVQGELAGKVYGETKQLDIRVRLPPVDRNDVDDVSRVIVGVVEGIPVRLSSVAEVSQEQGPAEIRRLGGRRGLRIQARLADADLGRVASEVQAVLDAHALDDPGVEAELAGQAEEMAQSLWSLGFTALLSVFLVYVVMASSFESLHHPFLIMFTVPLALVGVVAGVLVTGIPISAMVGIGAIILGGIVVNNAIVLVNAVNARRGAGMDVHEALVAAGRTRVRPILMTTATTVLGLLPMALGAGEGAALRQPLAVAVIGGLTVSTVLTLLVIPAAYAIAPGRRRDAWSEEV